jgi:hypothetical protein
MSEENLRDSEDIRFLDHCEGVVWREWLEGKRGEWAVKNTECPIKKAMEHTRKFERLLTKRTPHSKQHAYTMCAPPTSTVIQYTPYTSSECDVSFITTGFSSPYHGAADSFVPASQTELD